MYKASLKHTKPRPKPTQEAVVKALMPCKEEHGLVKKRDGDMVNALLKRFSCPKPGCSHVSTVAAKSGYTNPYSHLKRCYGEEDFLLELYDDAIAEKECQGNQGSVGDFFMKWSATAAEKAMHDYIELIVCKSLPITAVEDQLYRKFSKHTSKFGVKRIREVIFQLVELTEKIITKELKAAPCGAIMHDGWSCCGTHYVGVFACYMRKEIKPNTKATWRSASKKLKLEVKECFPEITLLAVAPMTHVPVAEEDSENAREDEETTKFNAEAHVNFFSETLGFYGLELQWVKASIADNTSTNLKVARLIGCPHVGCNNHKLNLDVELMVANTIQLKNVIENVHAVMLSAKRKLKNAALLRNLTNLKPVIHNKTRWSGKHFMLTRFLRIRDELIEVADNEESVELDINTSAQFLAKVKKNHGHLKEINAVTVFMQTRLLSLAQCRGALDMMINQIQENKTRLGHVFYGCTFTASRTLADSHLAPNADFESGVVKIQNGAENDLTADERVAVESLARVCDEDDDGDDLAVPTSPVNMQERLRRMNDRGNEKSRYVDCDFIFGSAAEVERLWSVADFILRDQRKAMTPQLFEALIFLKVNKRFWGLNDVCLAMKEAKSAMAEKRIADDIMNQDLNE
jgi:hypothetical protein